MIFRELSDDYPHWDAARLQPDELWKKHRGRLLSAGRVCGEFAAPCPPFLRTLRNMFAELQNGHTLVIVCGDTEDPAVAVEMIEGQAVVTWVAEGSDAEEAGIAPGAVILAVDGRPVQEALQGVPDWIVTYVSPETRRRERYRRLLTGPADSTVTVLLATAELTPVQAVLRRTPANCADTDDLPVEDLVWAGQDEEGFGHLAISSFSWEAGDGRYDRVFDAVANTKGLVIDIRENPGGLGSAAAFACGRFFTDTVEIGEQCRGAAEPAEDGESDCSMRSIEPRGPAYTAPVAVLLDDATASAAEAFALAMCRTGRARCFGRTTAGETDATLVHDHLGAEFRHSICRFHPALGPLVLGVGIAPHAPIEWTVDDLRSGRDPDIEAAMAWLRSQDGSRRKPVTVH